MEAGTVSIDYRGFDDRYSVPYGGRQAVGVRATANVVESSIVADGGQSCAWRATTLFFTVREHCLPPTARIWNGHPPSWWRGARRSDRRWPS